MIKEVNGCDNCPFEYEPEQGGNYCMHPNSPDKCYISHDSKWQLITPDWCPLKTEEVVVRFITPESAV